MKFQFVIILDLLTLAVTQTQSPTTPAGLYIILTNHQFFLGIDLCSFGIDQYLPNNSIIIRYTSGAISCGQNSTDYCSCYDVSHDYVSNVLLAISHYSEGIYTCHHHETFIFAIYSSKHYRFLL